MIATGPRVDALRTADGAGRWRGWRSHGNLGGMLGIVGLGLLEALLLGLARLLLARRERVVGRGLLAIELTTQADGRTESEDHGAPAGASSG